MKEMTICPKALMAFQTALSAVELRLFARFEEKANASGGEDISQETLVEERMMLCDQMYSEKMGRLEPGRTKRPEFQMPPYNLEREVLGESGCATGSEIIEGKQGERARMGHVYVGVVRTEVGHFDEHFALWAQNSVHFPHDTDSVIQVLKAIANFNSLNRRRIDGPRKNIEIMYDIHPGIRGHINAQIARALLGAAADVKFHASEEQ
jgi:hypothetical protein